RKTGQSSGSSQDAELSDLPAMAGEREGLIRFSAGGMARPDTVAVLQLSLDGRSWDDLHRRDGPGCAAALARKTVWRALDVVGVDAWRAASLYCEHGGMDDCRTRAAALADLRIDAHRQRYFSARGCRQCLVHSDRVHGHVHNSGDPVAVPDLSRDRTRTGTGGETARRRSKRCSGELRRAPWD